MKARKSFMEKVSDSSALNGENLAGYPLIEICGDRRVLIEHHKGVLQYSTDQIVLRVKYGQIVITGQDMRICKLCGQQLVIAGLIRSVTLNRR